MSMGRPRRASKQAETAQTGARGVVRAAGYIRVSSDGQAADGFSLADQRKRIAAHAVAAGYELIGIFEDAAVSGKSADRPALTELLYAAERGELNAVIVVKLDRLTRSLRDLLTLSDRLD